MALGVPVDFTDPLVRNSPDPQFELEPGSFRK